VTPHTLRGTTSSSTSSIKSKLIANLILYYYVTFIFASLFTHPSGHGLGRSQTSNPNFLTSSFVMRLSYNRESNRASILVLLTCIFIWKSLIIFSLLVVDGYSYSPPFALKYIRSSHPFPRFFQLGFLNQWP